jgi:hypothetical protein
MDGIDNVSKDRVFFTNLTNEEFVFFFVLTENSAPPNGCEH